MPFVISAGSRHVPDVFPHFKSLFQSLAIRDLNNHPKLKAQAKVFNDALASFVDNLDDGECLAVLIKKMTENHFKRGIRMKEFQVMSRDMYFSLFVIDYSEIPLLRPPKIKTFCQLKTLFAKFKLFVSSFSSPSVSLIRDHLWDCPKLVFKTTFGQSQRWS